MEGVFQWTCSRTVVNARRDFMEPCVTSRKNSSTHAENCNANTVTVRSLTAETPTATVRWATAGSCATRVREQAHNVYVKYSVSDEMAKLVMGETKLFKTLN